MRASARSLPLELEFAGQAGDASGHAPASAQAEGTLDKLLKELIRVVPLALDDFALVAMDRRGRHDSLDTYDARYLVHSTVLTSPLPVHQ